MTLWNILNLLSFLLGTACLGLGILVLGKSVKDQRLTRLYFVFAASMGLWMISVGVSNLTSSLPELVLWTKIPTIVSAVGVVSFAAFARLFRHPGTSSKTLSLWLIPIILITTYIVSFPPNQVYVADPFLGRAPGEPLGGVVNNNYALYIPLIFIVIIWSLGTLLRGRKNLPRKVRNQIYYTAFGTAVMMFSGIVFDSVLPVLGIDYLYSLGPALAIVWVGTTAYAIFRHELLDIRIFIQRGVIYSTIFTVTAGVYLLLIFGLNSIFTFGDKLINFISGLVAVLLGIFGIPPMEKYFRKKTDRFFFKDRYDYAQTLHELSAILNNSIEQRDIIRRAEALLKKTLRVSFVRISLSPIQEEASLNIPLNIHERRIGAMALGPKLSGDHWDSLDLKLLDTFAYQAAVALEKSRLYQELKEYSENLEQQVASRTQSLKELQEHQKLLMLDIAHNLQTPLTALHAELTLKKNNFSNVEKSISEVSKFIYDLLTLARLESKSEAPAPNMNADFSEIVGDVVEYVNVLAEQQGIKLADDVAPGIIIPGHPDELKTLITNLLSNAIKYSHEQAAAAIQVSLKRSALGAELTVSDNGIGIAPEELPNIFKRFYRAGHETAPGSGLGLAICKAIVEKHGGRILIASEPGRGTEVRVSLPAKAER